MALDIHEIIMTQQAANFDAAGKCHTQTLDLQAKVSIKKYDEIDPLQAASVKELGKAGLSVDLASIREPALSSVAG